MQSSDKLTVMTWFWKQPHGRASYTADHVNLWAAMVRRHLTLPHRIACVTAHPEGIDPDIHIITPPGDFEDVVLPTWGPDKPQCLRRIALFRKDAAEIFGPRYVSMDMDCVIADSLDPLFDVPDDFKMFRGTHSSRPYNGSMLMMTAGARPQVYDRFTTQEVVRAGRTYMGSDQAWISYVLGRGEATWGVEDGIQAYRSRFNTAPARVLFFFGNPKPWQVVGDPFIDKHYRILRTGRCLIIGSGPTLWDDLDKALDGKSYAEIITAPEVEAVLPENIRLRVRSFADNDGEAIARAQRLGYQDITFCGRSMEGD